jgi:ReqiPepy6 Gp37-like protein
VVVFGPYYDIHIYNPTGTRQLVLDGWEYLEYTQRIDDAWNHLIRINVSIEDDRVEFFRETMQRDWIIEAYRTSAFGSRDLVYEGFNRTIVDQIKQDGSVVFTLYGTGYLDLLKRRVVVPAAGQTNSELTGVSGTIMLQYVDEQCINPTDAARDLVGLSNGTGVGIGGNAAYSARYTNLFTVISRLAEQGNVDFGISKGTSVGTFVFDVRALWGTDRSVGNAGGNPPTIFDIAFNNMEIPILSLNGSDEITFVYIGGQGEGAARTIRTLEDTAASAISPWNRQEAFVDARNESTNNGLDTHGQAYLNQHRYQERLTFNIEQTEGTQWLRDWKLGDIITAKYGGRTFRKKIVKINVIHSAGDTGNPLQETIDVDTEDE